MGATTQQVIEDGQKYVMNTYGRLPIVIDKGQGCYVWPAFSHLRHIAHTFCAAPLYRLL